MHRESGAGGVITHYGAVTTRKHEGPHPPPLPRRLRHRKDVQSGGSLRESSSPTWS